MIVFALGCALMLLLAMVLLARPLLRRAEGESSSGKVSVFILTSLTVSLLAAAVYLSTSNWSWHAGASSQAATTTGGNTEIEQLLDRTRTAPGDLASWLELGRAYAGAGSYALASNAYQQAYDLSKGQDMEAITGLAESLVLTDQNSMNGRAALLIEEALKLQPNHPKALWYGGLVALQAQNLSLARDRFKALLALNPPQQVRALLERQVQDLTQQLGETGQSVAAASARKILVKVGLSAALKQQLKQPVSLFVLARNPQQPGAPLAVERHQSSELPLQVELTAADAMLPSRTLASAAEVVVVARLSASGMPTEQSGDYYGTAAYSFTRQGEQGSVTIEINQRVP
ncbi:MAG: tetratricopeptide repeat protein [Steroidobacteraceae bacterium]